VSYINTDMFEITRDDAFLTIPAPKDPKRATRKARPYCPAERQPQPALAGVADLAAAKVRAGGVVRVFDHDLVDHAFDGV
jgi:hypothetical protein